MTVSPVARLNRTSVLDKPQTAPGTLYPVPEACATHGCDWPAACTMTVPEEWRSGYYEVRMYVEVSNPPPPPTPPHPHPPPPPPPHTHKRTHVHTHPLAGSSSPLRKRTAMEVRRRVPGTACRIIVGETVILLHPPLPSVGISI